MRSNNIIFFFLILVFVSAILVFYLRTSKIVKNQNISLKYKQLELQDYHRKYEVLREIFMNQYKMNYSKISDFKLNHNDETIYSVVKDTPIFVVRFSEYNCHVCIDSLIIPLKKKLLDNYSSNKIVFLVSYENKRGLSLFKKQYGINKNIFDIEQNSIQLDQYNAPYMFKLDSTLIPRAVFFPDNNILEVTMDYIDFIESELF